MTVDILLLWPDEMLIRPLVHGVILSVTHAILHHPTIPIILPLPHRQQDHDINILHTPSHHVPQRQNREPENVRPLGLRDGQALVLPSIQKNASMTLSLVATTLHTRPPSQPNPALPVNARM